MNTCVVKLFGVGLQFAAEGSQKITLRSDNVNHCDNLRRKARKENKDTLCTMENARSPVVTKGHGARNILTPAVEAGGKV